MELIKAKEIAVGLWTLLKPHCDLIKIAGSIRREKPEVGDIELVALPKTVMGKDLFGNDTSKTRSFEFKSLVMGLGEVIKGKTDGRYMQIQLKDHDIKLDLFMPERADYWRQYVIRTGSADWVSRYIAGGWKKLGWCGTDQGLRLQKECEAKTNESDGKKKWICTLPAANQTLPPVWDSEPEFFGWLNLRWTEPKDRNI